jgi:1-acylglycerone phosphate reductase
MISACLYTNSCGKGGIGHALAVEFKKKGVSKNQCSKLFTDNSMPGFTVVTTLLAHESREHLIDAGIWAFAADVTKDADIEKLREEVASIGHGRLDILVNNA